MYLYLLVLDDIIGNVEGLDLCFVAAEELEPDGIRAVGSRGIGYPRQVRVGKEIYIHGVSQDSFVEPFRHSAEGIVEPDFGDEEVGVEEDDRVVVERKRGLLFSGLRPV